MLQLHRELDAVDLLDGDDHAAVTQPLGDANAVVAGNVASDGPERAEQAARGVIAECCRVVREAGEVHERKGAWYAHALPRLACRSWLPASHIRDGTEH